MERPSRLLPIGVFAGVIAFLGVDLLYTWLWEERRRLPLRDFAVVRLILGLAATVGFLQAIAVGMAAAEPLVQRAAWAQRPRVDNGMIKALPRAFRSRNLLDEERPTSTKCSVLLTPDLV